MRATVTRPVSSAAAIRLSLHPSPASPASAFNKMRALVNFRAGCLPLWIRAVRRSRSSALSFTTYFFTAISFTVTNRLRRYVTELSIRTSCPMSMTWPTSQMDKANGLDVLGQEVERLLDLAQGLLKQLHGTENLLHDFDSEVDRSLDRSEAKRFDSILSDAARHVREREAVIAIV